MVDKLKTNLEAPVLLGKINGLHGVDGWVKVFSHTEPRQQIFTYKSWFIKFGDTWKAVDVLNWRGGGKILTAQLDGYSDRDQSAKLIGSDIAIDRSEFPPSGEGNYYWIDLIGMDVLTQSGENLGKIDNLFSTGANDVVVVKSERERLLPWVMDEVIKKVDFDRRELIVDWDPEF